ncbi:MAG: hypothetical protein ISR58_18720 [Anaerolineales bacterium]|nr:hypothetical protein [Chloroflexota bacterium]MBL6983215.1 hypothetical protein [Anaerolineales bacterium]
MNQIIEWLSGGDRRSDGASDEVVALILENPEIVDDLYVALSYSDGVVRGRASDAAEKIGRQKPELFISYFPEIIQAATEDSNFEVRFHLAMLLGHMAMFDDHADQITATLKAQLKDKTAFVKSWSIASLCILARLYPDKKEAIIREINSLESDKSIAVRTRVRKGLEVLLDDVAPFPPGWIKSEKLKERFNK